MSKVAVVYLRSVPDFSLDRKRAFHQAELVPVAVVESQSQSPLFILEDVWQTAQNAYSPWHTNDKVHLLREGCRLVQRQGGLRSLSVGDVVEYSGILHLAWPLGYKKLRDVVDNPGMLEIDPEEGE